MIEFYKPLIIEDVKFFSKPSCDRKILADLVAWLATKAVQTLKEDKAKNQRYACDLKLSNKVVIDTPKPRKRPTEFFQVNLPRNRSTWNDVDSDDMQLKILTSIVNVQDRYNWYKVKAHFSDFVGKETKAEMDRLDDEVDDSVEVSLQSPGENEVDMLDNNNSDSLGNCKPSTQPTPNSSNSAAAPVAPQEEDDDDDDCIIVQEVIRRRR